MASRALRELSGGLAAAAGRHLGRTSRPSTRSRAPPTTSPTKMAARTRTATPPRRLAGTAARGGRGRQRRRCPAQRRRPCVEQATSRAYRRDLSRPAVDTDPNARLADRAVRGAAVGLPAGRHHHPLRDLGRGGRLLPPLGQPGRPPRPAALRAPRRAVRPVVRRHLHGAPAHELLAGLRPRLAPRPAIRAGSRVDGQRRQSGTALGGHDDDTA